MTGLIAHLTFSNKGIDVKVDVVENQRLNLCLISPKSLDHLNRKFKLFGKYRWFFKIQTFFLRVIEPKIFYYQMSDKSLVEKVKGFRIRKLMSFVKS